MKFDSSDARASVRVPVQGFAATKGFAASNGGDGHRPTDYQSVAFGLCVDLTNRVRLSLFFAVLSILSGLIPTAGMSYGKEGEPSPAAKASAAGRNVYVQQCQSCHGEAGVGQTAGYSEALRGDASINELVELISDTMPEEDPEACVGEDARQVAQYIYDAFYSPAAQLRNRPPQQQFSRLTGSQLRQSLADLYQHFYGPSWVEKQRGVKGNYFNGGRWKKEQLKIDRVDEVLDFDFGHDSPGDEIGKEEFYIHWSGSLHVDHSGRYEIVVESTCSMKMKFGHSDRVLIDNHVQSEGRNEFRRSLYLTGGRQYPFWIDFTKRKRKTETPPAKFSLRWVPPGGVESVIPTENLVPSTLPNSFALQAKLPPDDRSYGYDRGTRVDRQWDDAVTTAAIEFGLAAATELWPQFSRRNKKVTMDGRERLRQFMIELASTAFRGEWDEEINDIYVESHLRATEDDQMAIRRCCLMLIKSPRFLYPTASASVSKGEAGGQSDAVAASRVTANLLSLTLHDSLPVEDWLLKEIEKGRLDPEAKNADQQLRQTAERMVMDPRVGGKVMEMFYEWLDLDPNLEMTKDLDSYKGFDTALVGDLRRSLDADLRDIFWSEGSDYRRLFTQDWNHTTKRLGSFYEGAWQPKPDVEEGQLVPGTANPGKSFGVLAHPLVMGHLSYYETTSPIHRGVFLIRRVLGRTLRPPNEAFTPLDPELHPDLTTRQRVELQTGSEKCQVCHLKINGLGFALENYDAVGRYREKEGDRQIDTSGHYTTRDGEKVEFKNVSDLAEFLAHHDDAHRAFVERVFEHFVKQPIAAFGDDTIDQLVQSFRQHDFSIRQLIVDVAVVAATHPHQQEPENESA